jgi:hypothetical protein
MGIMKTFLGLTLRVTAALGAVGAVVTGVGVALVTKFSKGLMATREKFYLLETALTGVLKSESAVRKISEWAMKYAAKFPAMYSDVMDAMKGLAMMPSLKPMFIRGDVAAMEKIMHIVQGLAAIDPAQGIKGALFALREALSGQWRSMAMRFEIRPQDIASAAGLTMEELKNMPDKAIQALGAFVKLNVGADTLRKSAETLGVQWGNLTDKYEIWLNKVGQYGAYRKLVEFLMKINDIWENILNSDAAKQLGQDISRVFESVIASMQATITGIDWTGAGIFDGIIEAGKNVIGKISKLFVDAKDVFASSMQVVVVYMKEALILSIKHVFWPVGVEIAKAIGDAFMETIQKHPMKAWLFSMAAGGMVGGVPGALAAGGTTAAVLAVQGAGVRSRQGLSPAESQIKDIQKEISKLEGELQTSSGWLNFWKGAGYSEQAKTKLKSLKQQVIELKSAIEQTPKEPTLFGKESKAPTLFGKESKAALQKWKADTKALIALWGELLGPRKEIPTIDIEKTGDAKNQVDLETKLLSLSKQKLAIEQKYANAKRQQIGIQRRIQIMEMMKGDPGEIGVSTLERSEAHFQTFYEKWMKKKSVRGRYGWQARIPGVGGMTWATGATRSTAFETKGIPAFLLKQERILRQKLKDEALSPAAEKILLEKLYGANVQQFEMARGRTAKGVQFLEANEIMSKLQGVEIQLQEEQIALAKEQAGNIKNTVVELKVANKWLSGINSKISGVPVLQSQSATPSSLGNKKITGANPGTMPFPAGAF